MEKLGLGDARQIQAMLNGEEVASSKLPSRMAGMLREEGLLLTKNNGSRCKYRMAESMRESCRVFLAQQFGLKCPLDEWIEAFGKSQSKPRQENKSNQNKPSLNSVSLENRATLVSKVGNSKYKKVKTFRGFLVDCYSPIEATLNHHPFLLSPQEGCSVFINTPETFEIPDDVVVVGIENAENFMHIRKQKNLFESMNDEENVFDTERGVDNKEHFKNRFLFVCRYPQENLSDLRAWLKRIPNHYVHFGDFDLAGVHIYLSEFYAHLGRQASFLIPSDLEERLANGNADLYDKQYARFKDMDVRDSRILPLVNMIHHYRKGYEQEGYIQ